MGQVNSTSPGTLDAKETIKYQEFVKNYQFLRRIKDPRYGEISVLQDKFTKELVALKELLSKSTRDFEKDINSLRIRYKTSHPNIVKVLGYTSKSEDNFCASVHKILMIVEYLENDLEKEITLKKNQNSFYKEDQLWYLLENIVKALALLQRNEVPHEDLKPSSILISKMGVYKIAQHNIAGTTIPAYHQRLSGMSDGRTYLSPALLSNLQRYELKPNHNSWKSDVFSLGMIVLHAATLSSCERLYDWNNNTLNYNQLQERISSLKPRYSQNFQDCLHMMLDNRENTRPDFIKLEARIQMALSSSHKLNPTPGNSPHHPRTNEASQDVPEDMLEDINSHRFDNPAKRKAVPIQGFQTDLNSQRNGMNSTFSQDSRIASIRLDNKPSIIYEQQPQIRVEDKVVASSKSPKFINESKPVETSVRIFREAPPVAQQTESRPMYSKAINEKNISERGMAVKPAKGFSFVNQNEHSEAGGNSSTHFSDLPPSINTLSHTTKLEEKTPASSINDVHGSYNNQDQFGGQHSNSNLSQGGRKSVISNEVARIISEFRNKMGIENYGNEANTSYNPVGAQNSNLKTEYVANNTRSANNQVTNVQQQQQYQQQQQQQKNPYSLNPASPQNIASSSPYNQSAYNSRGDQQISYVHYGDQRSENNSQHNTMQGNISKSSAYGANSNIERRQHADLYFDPFNAAPSQGYSSNSRSDYNNVNDNKNQRSQNYYRPENTQTSYRGIQDFSQNQATSYNPASQGLQSSYIHNPLITQEAEKQSHGYGYSDQQFRPSASSIPTHENYRKSAQLSAAEMEQSSGYKKANYSNQQHEIPVYSNHQDESYRLNVSGLGNESYLHNQSQTKANNDPYLQKNTNFYGNQNDYLAQTNFNHYDESNNIQVSTARHLEDSSEPVTETYADGSVYEGQKLNGLRHGKGTFYYSDGGMYSGDWFEGSMEGYGSLFYASGVKAYEGEWKADRFHGKGVVYNETPTQLSGGFDFTNFDLIGDYWVQYEGHFYNDNKEGSGVLVLSNGENYQGEFREDMVHGIGHFHTMNRGAVKGEWWENKLAKQLR